MLCYPYIVPKLPDQPSFKKGAKGVQRVRDLCMCMSIGPLGSTSYQTPHGVPRVSRVSRVEGALHATRWGATRNSTTLLSISKRIEHAGEVFFCTSQTIGCASACSACTKNKCVISKSRKFANQCRVSGTGQCRAFPSAGE